MAPKSGNYQIPFAHDGMMQYPSRYWHDGAMREPRWVDNFEFEASLRLTGFSRGRSAAGFVFKNDATNETFYMFMKDMEQLIQNSVIDHGIVKGKWTFCKRGANYGLKPVFD